MSPIIAQSARDAYQNLDAAAATAPTASPRPAATRWKPPSPT